MLQEKRYYLDCLKDGPLGHRHIMQRFTTRFNISATVVRDLLMREGLIHIIDKKRIGKTQKFNYIMDLVNKDAVVEMPQPQTHVIEDSWPDGWPKSTGNAFDWRNKEQQIFNKSEIAQMQQKQSGNRPITVYSRA